MYRRAVLAGALTLVSAGTAGCIGGGGVGGDAGTDGPPALADQSLSMTDGECGSGLDEASASFGDGRVTITGTISARDRCRVARLASAEYDADADELSVAVETEKTRDVCAQCISDVHYEATFSFDGGLPGAVTVSHASRGRERTVLETTRDG